MHKSITTRQMKTFNKESFLNDLVQVDWKGIASHSDAIDPVVDQWTTVFSIILEEHAPFRDRRVRDRFCPWVTKDLRQIFIVRDRLKNKRFALNHLFLWRLTNKCVTESIEIIFN